MLSGAIVTLAHRLRNALCGELHAAKTAKSSRFKHHYYLLRLRYKHQVAVKVVLRHFQGKFQDKKLFQREKIHSPLDPLFQAVRYAKVEYEGFFCTTIIKGKLFYSIKGHSIVVVI